MLRISLLGKEKAAVYLTQSAAVQLANWHVIQVQSTFVFGLESSPDVV